MRFNRIKAQQCKKYISPAVYTHSLSYIYRLHCAASRRGRIIENNAAQTRNADIANKSRGSGEVERGNKRWPSFDDINIAIQPARTLSSSHENNEWLSEISNRRELNRQFVGLPPTLTNVQAVQRAAD
jgi:hypothetical protein